VPVYEYACTECGERLEVRQSFTDDPLTECPACSGRLRKVLSAVGVVFKGSGFYRTDARSAANGADGGSEKKEPASVGAGKESSSDSGSSKSAESASSNGSSSAAGSSSSSHSSAPSSAAPASAAAKKD
jgi:putative FmdB family regulatory protein